MRRIALVVLLVVLGAASAAAAPAGAQPAPSAAALSASDVGADFDNDGVADLAIGVPGRTARLGR